MRLAFALAVCLFIGHTSTLFAADLVPMNIQVPTTAIELHHPRDPYRIVALGQSADGYSIDLGSKATFSVRASNIARIDADGWVTPLANGSTEVVVKMGEREFIVPVKVQLQANPEPIRFRHEIMPILSKGGCNMGACHGYSLGKNGFKLSLRGADAPADYTSIRSEFAGRRLNFQAPATSLLLTKAVGVVPHEGGKRFDPQSHMGRLLAQWLEQGAPSDLSENNEVVGVRMVPAQLVLRPGDQHRVQLIATYADGRQRDVTKLGIFSANNDRFATVSEDGLVRAGDNGETVIVGRFERTFAATGVVVLQPKPTFTPAPVPNEPFIDRHIITKLNRLKITPSALASDEEFLRRVYLDLIGLQPKPDEVKAFLADADPKKRANVVDALLARPEFIDHWSLKWGDLLQNSRNSASPQAVFLFREWIRSAIASNMRMDEFARSIITARGGSLDDPAAVYFTISKDTNDTVERITQVFCGVRMLCARCHEHPMENWTQADYYSQASFFNQVGNRADARFPNVGNAKVVMLNLTTGLATNPRTGRPQPAKFLGGAAPKLEGNVDRRLAYAQWLTAADNPFFARGMVNRYWSYFFHRGIIDPVDDIRSTNPPINPELLDALTQDFISHRFDARHLIRRIVTSEAYQRSSVPNDSNRGDEQNFSRFVPRRVPAESLLDSLVQATAVPESLPNGFRAAQLPDATVNNAFLNLFGKPQRMDACECERDNGSNMLQALHFINGASILGRVSNPNARPALLLRAKLNDADLVTELFLWSLARRPRDAEMKLAIEFLQAHPGDKRAEGIQDLMWALLNSKDFLMIH